MEEVGAGKTFTSETCPGKANYRPVCANRVCKECVLTESVHQEKTREAVSDGRKH